MWFSVSFCHKDSEYCYYPAGNCLCEASRKTLNQSVTHVQSYHKKCQKFGTFFWSLFYMSEQILQFFLMFLLFLLDNFIATHLKSTDFAWVVFLYIEHILSGVGNLLTKDFLSTLFSFVRTILQKHEPEILQKYKNMLRTISRWYSLKIKEHLPADFFAVLKKTFLDLLTKLLKSLTYCYVDTASNLLLFLLYSSSILFFINSWDILTFFI